MTFALVGNQNCGKTTLFNRLTGSNQHVGNFPGVTVSKKSGQIRGLSGAEVVDLPGVYSLRPYSAEEAVTRDFLLNGKPDGVINIVDATNPGRNLYLTLQLLELRLPMVVALNMMDEVRASGGEIRAEALSQQLGVPVIPISAAKNEGIDALIAAAEQVAREQTLPEVHSIPSDPLRRCMDEVSRIVKAHAARLGCSVRFAAMNVIEGDGDFAARLGLDADEQAAAERAVAQMEAECGLDRMTAVAAMRYDCIEAVCAAAVRQPEESRERARSRKIDDVLTHRVLAIPIFLAVMLGIFYLTFDLIGQRLSDLLAFSLDGLTLLLDRTLTGLGVHPVLHSLLIDGVAAGIGSVLCFLPLILTLFFFLSLLEDTGYMARIAFVMDRPLRRIGLTGRSIVPMLLGFGCSVPAIMATRTLPGERDRKLTVMLVPFMSCSAKIPIYTVFIAAFFPRYKALAMVCIYGFGILAGLLFALAANRAFPARANDFVMELPDYRLPTLRTTALLLWDKAAEFLKRAFTVILAATVIVWFLQAFDLRLHPVSDTSESLLAALGRWIAPIFAPLGLNDWRIVTSLLSGLAAKEAVIGSLGVLLGGAAPESVFTLPMVFAFLTFTLLYTPCFAAVAAIRQELHSGLRAIGAAALQCVIAWICGAVIYRLTSVLLGAGALTSFDLLLPLLFLAALLLVKRTRCAGDCSCCSKCG